MAHSNRYNGNIAKIDRDKEYGLEEAAELLLSCIKPKFDESIEMAINLGVDPKHADQIVRGTVPLPNGIGKEIKVLVFAKDNLAEQTSNVLVIEKSVINLPERSNNWMSVQSKDDWLGLSEDQIHERQLKFDTPEQGIRAGAISLITRALRKNNKPELLSIPFVSQINDL